MLSLEGTEPERGAAVFHIAQVEGVTFVERESVIGRGPLMRGPWFGGFFRRILQFGGLERCDFVEM